MPGVDFNILRTEITMEQVLDRLGFQPTRRAGSQLHGPCPVHGYHFRSSQRTRRGRRVETLCRRVWVG